MYRSNSYNYRTVNTLVESMMCTDLSGVQKFKTLTETEKKDITKNMAANLYRSIKSKAHVVDYSDLEHSKGDITKFQGYEYLEKSINFLVTMYDSQPNPPSQIPTLKNSLDFLIKYKKQFNKAFNNREELKKMLYMNFSVSLVYATSLMIASTVDYIKDPLGNYTATFKKMRKNHGDFHIKQLEKILKMDQNGQIRTFFGNKDIIQESVQAIGDRFYTESTVSAVIIVTIIILAFLRDIVFFFFRARVRLANYLLELAYFVEANHMSLENQDAESHQDVIRKQEKVVEKLRTLADKIAIDDLKGKDVHRDIEQNDKEVAEDSQSGELDVLLV